MKGRGAVQEPNSRPRTARPCTLASGTDRQLLPSVLVSPPQERRQADSTSFRRGVSKGVSSNKVHGGGGASRPALSEQAIEMSSEFWKVAPTLLDVMPLCEAELKKMTVTKSGFER
ncbi:hypothetical protein MTO96_049840 [Rhipicephalus appendiculatus]